ncbi:MAG: hypothetical protein ACO25B_10040 [Chitinophagaceae bacterium]
MPFFDFHLHPSLKAQFSGPADKPSPWDPVLMQFRDPDLLLRILKCQGINEIVDSQASLSQLIQGGVNLVTIALHPPESAMMRDGLIQKIAEEEQTRYINNEKVDEIGTGNIYFRLLNEELDHLEANLENRGRKLRLIRHIGEYDESDMQTIHAILSVEGPHAFYGNRDGKTFEEIMTDFRENFRQFTRERKVRIFSMNIAHLQDNDFCNHAFGIQVFRPEPFFPSGRLISEEGLRLLLAMKAEKILCDIKHTSFATRQQLFSMQLHGSDWPLVCTHAGLTGIHSGNRYRYFLHSRSFGNGYLRVKHYKPRGYLDGTSFNASSINLYDDDVVAIIRSGGLIGLSMDQRILGTPEEGMLSPGYPDELFEQEVISPGERDLFRDRSLNRDPLPPEAVLKTEDIQTADRQNSIRYHARHFLNQVFHLFVIARLYDIPATTMAERICIGSDFDGMINPVDCCRDVTELGVFKSLLQENFMRWEEEFSSHHANGFRVSDLVSPPELLDLIFYGNGLGFLRRWYT